jgi:hypothetical protein
VGDWWRWVLRSTAVLAIGAGGALLAAHPSASFRGPGGLTKVSQADVACVSPLDRLQGDRTSSGPPRSLSTAVIQEVVLPAVAACNAATNVREHTVEALGISGVIVIGMSFAPRRRRDVASPQRFAVGQAS